MTAAESLDVAALLSEVARTLQAPDGVEDTLQAIVTSALDSIPGATSAAVTLVTERVLSTPAATDELALAVDSVQYRTGQGPCLAAIAEQRTVLIRDMGTDDRWPQFTSRVLELGVRSMLAFQLFVREGSLGALNLYSTDVDSFGLESMQVGELFAAHAAVALADAESLDHLSVALSSRDVIGQAKGILMERFKIGAEDAFQILVRASQLLHRKLRDVAEELTRTGEVPRAVTPD